MESELCVDTPVGGVVVTDSVYKSCVVKIADVASAFPWVITYGIRAGPVIPCGFRDTIPQSGP